MPAVPPGWSAGVAAPLLAAQIVEADGANGPEANRDPGSFFVALVQPILDPKLAEVVHRLVRAYEPDRVYLFGSHARGSAGPDSDYDVLVVVPDDAPSERRRGRLAYEVLWGTGTAADVVVWTRSQFEGRAHLAASLAATVLREGKLVHAA